MGIGMGSPLIMMLAIALLVAGVTLAVLGWRGRRVGDEPRCRGCGYDLRGVDDDAACPECGAPSSQRRIGTRRRRPVLLVSGTALLLIGTTGFIQPIRQRMANFDYYAITPTWLLVRWVEDHGDITAADTVARRWLDGEVDDAQVVAALSPLVHVTLKTRPHHAERTTIPIMVRVSSIPRTSAFPGWSAPTVSQFRFETKLITDAGTNSSTGRGLGSASSVVSRRDAHPHQPFTYAATAEVTVITDDPARSVSWSSDHVTTSEVVDTSIEWPGLTLLRDAETEARIVDLITQDLDVPSGSVFQATRGQTQIQVPTLGLAGDVPIYASLWVEQDGRRYQLDPIVHDGGEPADTVFTVSSLNFASVDGTKPGVETWRDELQGDAVLILEPDLERAWFLPAYDRIWAKELRFRLRITEDRVEIVDQITDW